MIEGVRVKKLKIVPDERGRLMEILRRDDDIFEKFGQVYMTTAFKGVVKAWHYHKIQTDNFTCISGKMKLALYDPRPGSPTCGKVDEFIISLDSPMLVQIPPMIYHGFKSIGEGEAVVVNTVTVPYNPEKPDEFRVDAYDNDIDYDWRR